MAVAKGDILDRYEIIDEIGEGGMAVVYRARHQVLGSEHAIKILHEQYARQAEVRKRFLDEGKIQAQNRHPNITPITEIIALPGVAGLVMPLLIGQDLEAHIQQAGAVPTDQAITWTQQILSALAHVHTRRIVHRDLKPANIFLEQASSGGTTVQVMDFGIAKVLDSTQTRTAMALGTPAYMAPEQIRSPKDVDARTDLFAVGAILYEMLAGRPAFEGDTEFDIQSRIVQGRFAPLRETRHAIPGYLGAVIDRALSVAPDARYQTAADFLAALAPPPGTDVTPPPAPAPPPPALELLKESVIATFVAQVTVPGRWRGLSTEDGVWVLEATNGFQKARLTVAIGHAELRIRSGLSGGGRNFVPQAESHPQGWRGASRTSVSRVGWYAGEPWIIEDERGAGRAAWLINQEWEGVSDPREVPRPPARAPAPAPAPVPLAVQARPEAEVDTGPVQTDTAAQRPHVNVPRVLLSVSGATTGFLLGLPAGGIGAVPGAVLGGVAGYWAKEIGFVLFLLIMAGIILGLIVNSL